MGAPVRKARLGGRPAAKPAHRAGFEFDAASLSEAARERLTGAVLGFIADAIELDRRDLLAEWELAAHPVALRSRLMRTSR